MVKIKTEDLNGTALDWAVAKCEGHVLDCDERDEVSGLSVNQWNWAPSKNWSQGGPILDREEIGTRRVAPCTKGREWEACPSITAKGAGWKWGYGPTPLIAAMRCYVASKLGDVVDIPEELIRLDAQPAQPAQAVPFLDCRTCAHFTRKSGGCMSVVQCVSGDRFVATRPHQYWEAAPLPNEQLP